MREAYSGFFFLGLALLAIVESLRMGTGTMKEPGAGFLSLAIGLILAVFSLVLIIRGWKPEKGSQLVKHSATTIIALVALFIYSLIMDSIGFVVATFLLVAVLFHLAERRRWWVLLGMSALVTAFAYLLFGVVLKVYFPEGILGS
jgi:putative tricarboxylic transport membrane protein